MVDTGYIYVIAMVHMIEGLYKIGKTNNIKTTAKTYKRQGNVNHDYIQVGNHLSYIETLVLNILGPYRTLREDQQKISESIRIRLRNNFSVIDTPMEIDGEEEEILTRSTFDSFIQLLKLKYKSI